MSAIAWIAIGQPGELPRCWYDGPTSMLAAQLRAGEISSTDVQVDDEGNPIPKTLPAAVST